MKSDALKILVISLTALVLLVLFSQVGFQNSLAYYLGLEPQNESQQTIKKQSGSETGKVNRVIDGDTIVLEDGRTIRYLNIDTPETKKPNTAVQCFGPEASSYNRNLVEGKKVQLKSDKERQDRYGRELRFVFMEGRDTDLIENSINAIMVKEGFARTMIIKPNNTYEKNFIVLERVAKESSVGIWNSCSKPFDQ